MDNNLRDIPILPGEVELVDECCICLDDKESDINGEYNTYITCEGVSGLIPIICPRCKKIPIKHKECISIFLIRNGNSCPLCRFKYKTYNVECNMCVYIINPETNGLSYNFERDNIRNISRLDRSNINYYHVMEIRLRKFYMYLCIFLISLTLLFYILRKLGIMD